MPDRPDVVFLLTDTQRWDSSGLAGNPLDLMPNFDRLARRGTHLVNAISPQPVCTPCRACLMTGTWATRNRVWRNGLSLAQNADTFPHRFAAAGYETAYFGKWHIAPHNPTPQQAVAREDRVGWQRWLAANAVEHSSEPYRTVLWDEEDREVVLPGYRCDAIVDAAIRFLAQPTDRPRLVFISVIEPHAQNRLSSFCAPEGYRERYLGRWTPPDAVGLPCLSDAGVVQGEYPHQALADYWGMVKRIDECVGRLQDALKSLGRDRDTAVCFTSDHGTHFNTRNTIGKSSCHEASIHVPAALWGGPFDGGGQVEQPVSLVDLPATLLDACGIAVPDTWDGRSFLPLLRDRRASWREEVFFQWSHSEIGRGVRTAHWKYAVVGTVGDPAGQPSAERYRDAYLYDLANDPYEFCNLITYASHRPMVTTMRERLVRQMVAAGEGAPVIEDLGTIAAGQRYVTDAEVAG